MLIQNDQRVSMLREYWLNEERRKLNQCVLEYYFVLYSHIYVCINVYKYIQLGKYLFMLIITNI